MECGSQEIFEGQKPQLTGSKCGLIGQNELTTILHLSNVEHITTDYELTYKTG